MMASVEPMGDSRQILSKLEFAQKALALDESDSSCPSPLPGDWMRGRFDEAVADVGAPSAINPTTRTAIRLCRYPDHLWRPRSGDAAQKALRLDPSARPAFNEHWICVCSNGALCGCHSYS
jgi:hypothetical protein